MATAATTVHHNDYTDRGGSVLGVNNIKTATTKSMSMIFQTIYLSLTKKTITNMQIMFTIKVAMRCEQGVISTKGE